MEEKNIKITLEEYRDLLRKAERIATVERMFASGYVSSDDIKAVLGIKEEKESEDEAV